MNLFNYIKKLIKIIVIIFLPIILNSSPAVHAQQSSSQVYSQNCNSKFADPNYKALYNDLYTAQQYDSQNMQPGKTNSNPSDLLEAGCPPSFADITLIVLRIVTVIITIFGIIVFFNLIRAAILYITAGANKDKIKAAVGTIQATFFGLAIILISYTLIVFFAVRLGLGNNATSGNSFSVVEGGRLLFRFIFEY